MRTWTTPQLHLVLLREHILHGWLVCEGGSNSCCALLPKKKKNNHITNTHTRSLVLALGGGSSHIHTHGVGTVAIQVAPQPTPAGSAASPRIPNYCLSRPDFYLGLPAEMEQWKITEEMIVKLIFKSKISLFFCRLDDLTDTMTT